MSSPRAGTANLLGALALAIGDQTSQATFSTSGQAGSSAAALSALQHILDSPSLEQLRQVLGLTPSGAVKLVDRMAGAGLVTRGPGADGRTRSITLTPHGRRAAEHITAARTGYLDQVLAGLTEGETQALHTLLGKVMAGIVEHKEGGAWICRLCDLDACGRTTGQCPTANAAALKYAHRPERPATAGQDGLGAPPR